MPLDERAATAGLTLVADTRDTVGESPVWLASECALLWTDILGRRLHRLDAATAAVRSWTAGEAIGSFAPAADGGFVAATENGFVRLAVGEGEAVTFTPIASVLLDNPGIRFNDGRCDRQGRFWASSMAWNPRGDTSAGSLWRLDKGFATKILDGLVIGNGLAWSADGRTMYLSESHVSRPAVWAFDFDADEGVPNNRRLFLDFAGTGGRPDGAAVDSDGCLWIAVTDAGLLRRYTPAGALDFTITSPVPHPTMPAFGGDDMRTLFVTSLRPTDTTSRSPDGGLFAIHLGQRGLEETRYKS